MYQLLEKTVTDVNLMISSLGDIASNMRISITFVVVVNVIWFFAACGYGGEAVMYIPGDKDFNGNTLTRTKKSFRTITISFIVCTIACFSIGVFFFLLERNQDKERAVVYESLCRKINIALKSVEDDPKKYLLEKKKHKDMDYLKELLLTYGKDNGCLLVLKEKR